MSKFPEVRVRFAPSPTGYLHVGGARTALYNYLFAKKNNGKFILRVEDTDEVRSTDDSLKMVLKDLEWLGLKWDEGPNPATLGDMGPYGPYKQSQRKSIYAEVAQDLLSRGLGYYCFLTDAEIDMQRQAAIAANKPPHISSPYESWPLEKAQAEIKAGKKAVVRFKTKQFKKDFVLPDLVRGDVRFPSDMVGDFVMLRSDGMPVYNFCCAVDDHLMKISHVLRAEEHLPNTLRQLMIYEAMGWDIPQFGHISLVLDDDRQKLSKRKGAVSCDQFKNDGYFPHALLNFIALLGWSHPSGEEVLTLEQMIDGFETSRLNPAGAVFDRQKLKWMNSVYLRKMSNPDLWNAIQPHLNDAGLKFDHSGLTADEVKTWQERSVEIFKTSMEILSDAVPLYQTLSDENFKIAVESAEALAWESTRNVFTEWIGLLKASNKTYLTEDEFLKLQDEVKNKTGAKGKFLFMA
ncbi:MAG: glutamate--tRNA ligase, partial [Pseudobdellovibrionaceae bacterium]